jgi:hypothetical protein
MIVQHSGNLQQLAVQQDDAVLAEVNRVREHSRTQTSALCAALGTTRGSCGDELAEVLEHERNARSRRREAFDQITAESRKAAEAAFVRQKEARVAEQSRTGHERASAESVVDERRVRGAQLMEEAMRRDSELLSAAQAQATRRATGCTGHRLS